MGKVTTVATTSDLADGMMKKYKVQDQEILVAKIEGKYYAVQNKCPHFGGDLSHGKLEGTIVTCPRHGSQFNLIDGSVVRWLRGTGIVSSIGKTLKPPQKLITCNLKVDGQNITVEI
jgi:3-phenylpropionate/trans-cinnamate dioxygenase ferredoxin component